MSGYRKRHGSAANTARPGGAQLDIAMPRGQLVLLLALMGWIALLALGKLSVALVGLLAGL